MLSIKMDEAMDIDTPEPRGIKRKADGDRPTPQPPKRIKVAFEMKL